MKSFPFDSQISGYTEEGYPIYDRAEDSIIFREIFKKYFTTGVFANPSSTFLVTQSTGMTINVNAGYANIEGAIAIEDKTRTLNIEASDSADRIDRIVLRLNDNVSSRKIDLYVLKGTPSPTPQAPQITRNDSVYDISLATVYISANAQLITQSKITDTRLDSSVCGIVAQAVNGIDTEALYIQIQDDLSNFQNVKQVEFMEWLKTIQGALSEDVAGKLLLQINDLKASKQNKVMYGYTEPTNSIGVDGDIYILIEGV